MATQRTLPNIQPYTHINSGTDGGVNHARRQPARREPSNRRIALGHLDTQLGGVWDRTNNLPVTRRPKVRRPVLLLPLLHLGLLQLLARSGQLNVGLIF